jgi:ribulose-5-phosphate 4-epimerase/fuculose-1-phosphate aldolase
MEQLVRKYAEKLISAGLAEAGAPLVGGLDADVVWNRGDSACKTLEEVFGALNINSLLFCNPAEPYRSIVNYLAGEADGAIRPNDTETRTFLHDLPVRRNFAAAPIIEALKARKSVIVPGEGIVTFGTVSPEQAFVTFSSVCFACFVKFFSDYLAASRAESVTEGRRCVFECATALLDPIPREPPPVAEGPFADEEEVYRAVSEAGRMTVQYRLVDSYFGNVSYRFRDTLYISQTTSSLDELEGYVDPVPLDGSSCAGITASSELTAHREVVLSTGNSAVLHGHPRFSVVMSMDCLKRDCPLAGKCHTRCPEKRFVGDVPIVPGEVGTGPWGLCNTLPAAMAGRRGAIVYGHGVFTVGRDDFNEALRSLIAIESMCRNEYFCRVAGGA